MIMHFIYFLFLFLPLTAVVGQNPDSSLTPEVNQTSQNRLVELQHLIQSNWLNYPDQAMIYGQEALSLSNALNDSLNISKSLRLLAGVHYYKGDVDSSMFYNEKALAMAVLLGDSALIGNGYNNIGLLYYNLGSNHISLEYLLKSLDLKMNRKDYFGYATTLNNIGLVYQQVLNLHQAKTYFQKALDVSRSTGNKDQEIYSQNNLGTVLLNEDSLEKAETYFNEALNLALTIENINWGAVSKRRLGEIRLRQGKYPEAEKLFNESLQNSLSISDKAGSAETFHLLAQLAIETKKFEEALQFLDKSHEIAMGVKLRNQLQENLMLYIEAYNRSNDYKNEILYLTKYLQLKDSLFQEVETRNITLVPIKIKEEQDRVKLSNQELQLQNKIYINRIYTITLFISIPFIFILMYLLRRNIMAYKDLRNKNQELKRTQHLLAQSEKMASLGILAAGIGHEINNPLNFIQNGVNALSEELDLHYKNASKEIKKYLDIIYTGVERIMLIVTSLSSFSRTNVVMNEPCNIEEIINNCLVILASKLKYKVEIVKKFQKGLPLIEGNAGKLHQVFLNLISNAEQAIQEQGTITISTNQTENNISILIEDDGIGIPEENINKISDPFFTTKPPGQGTGLGLFITYMIIQDHKGEITIGSELNKGTIIRITLPLVQS